jgi:putative ABC transport system permease protein
MGLKVGDTLTINLLGREITARIANLRAIDWTRLGINFAIVFAPGTLEAAPQTHLAAVYLPKDEADGLVRRVGDRFPNVSAIAVGDALAQIDNLIRMIGDAVRVTALMTLAAGVLVLGGAIASGQHRRVYDAVVLKVLGASRRTVAAGFMIEHGLLGATSAVLAGAIGTLAAYVVVTGPMRGTFVFLPRPLALTLVLATLLTLTLGFAGTWRALGTPAAPLLRHE